MTNLYYAWAQNKQGASVDVSDKEKFTSKRKLKDQARRELGSGWTVNIVTIYVDGDGQSTMGSEVTDTFKIR